MHRLACGIPRALIVVALAVTVAACGGRVGHDGADIPAAPSRDPGAAPTAAPRPDLTTAPAAAPASDPAPALALRDVSGIDAYLVDIDASLRADGGAGGQEGNDQ